MDNQQKHLVLCAFLTLVIRLEAQDAFTTLPVNTKGVIGQNVTLNCAISNPSHGLDWINSQDIVVYEKGIGVTPDNVGKYIVEESGNSYNLVVIGAVVDDAGQYTCFCSTVTSSAIAEVILLASEPGLTCEETTSNPDDDNFGNTVEGEEISLTCQTTFYGRTTSWRPKQDWKDSNDVILTPSNVSSGNLIEYTNVQTVTTAENGLRWIVDSYFPEPPVGVIPDDDTKEPGTTYYNRDPPQWNEDYPSTEIIVYYPVTNMNLDIVKDEYNPGEEITCTAQGNPDPTITWVDDNNNTVVESRVLTIEASMEGTQTYSCLATNVVRGTTYPLMRTITFNVTIPPTTVEPTTPAPTTGGSDEGTGNPGDGPTTNIAVETKHGDSGLSDGAIAGIVIGVIAFLIILAIILFFCCVKKAPQKKTAKTQPIAPVATIPTDHIRSGPPKPADNLSYVSEKPPPSPYNPYNPYAIPNSHHHSPSPYEANNLHYTDLALDDTPRSRKPIQVYEPTDYADIRRV